MRALVTGGAGLVGSAIARRLVAQGHDVTSLDVAPARDDLPGRYVQGDLRDAAAVKAAVEGMEGVFHTAALHVVHFPDFSNQDFIDINVGGTYNVLEAAVECGVRRVVHCSTIGVYGRATTAHTGPDLLEFDDDEIDAHRLADELYGLTKVLAEQTIEYFRATSELDVVAFRYGGVWELVRQIGWFRAGLEALVSGQVVTALDDVVASQVAAMLHAGPLPRWTYTVGVRSLVSAREVEAAGGDARAALAAAHPDLADALAALPAPRFCFDPSRVERDLGIAISGRAEDFLREALRELSD